MVLCVCLVTYCSVDEYVSNHVCTACAAGEYDHDGDSTTACDVCPAGSVTNTFADPGATIVKQAHEKGIQVIPLVGPSSILTALMASGLNGQNFDFNGYLPIDNSERKKEIKALEKLSKERNQSQIFIETPYRNEKMFRDLKSVLHPGTLLCIAIDISLPNEFIKTFTITEWKRQSPDLHKRPAIFIIQR